MIYENNEGGKYAANFVQTLQYPEGMSTPEFTKIYEMFANRILWMDGNVCPGAFQMNTAWYCAVPERDPIFTEHSHPYCELIGFFGSNPADPYNLNGEIVFAIDGEEHRLTRSTLIFIPENVPHNPMHINRVDTPIFHFSIVPNPTYNGEDVYK